MIKEPEEGKIIIEFSDSKLSFSKIEELPDGRNEHVQIDGKTTVPDKNEILREMEVIRNL